MNTPENLASRRAAVGIMIGIQALLVATGGQVIASHDTPQPAPSLIVQPEQPVVPLPVPQHHARHVASHHVVKPTHKVEAPPPPVPKPTPTPTHHAAHIDKAKSHIKAEPLSFVEKLQAVLGQLKGRNRADISMPNNTNLIPSVVDYGIVGVNDGHNFSLNPHLVNEMGRFPAGHTGLYANSDFAGVHQAIQEAENAGNVIKAAHGTAQQVKEATAMSQEIKDACPLEPEKRYDRRHPHKPKRFTRNEACVAEKSGEAAGRLDVMIAKIKGVYRRHWNVDIEFMRDQPWTRHKMANRANIQGEVNGIEKQSRMYRLGRAVIDFYSTGYMYRYILGRWFNNHMAWAATGHVGIPTALEGCEDNFTGAGVRRTQFVTDNLEVDEPNGAPHHESLDIDIDCPDQNEKPLG